MIDAEQIEHVQAARHKIEAVKQRLLRDGEWLNERYAFDEIVRAETALQNVLCRRFGESLLESAKKESTER